ncbi:hypothetical protein [Owenweeksia hongkongensis]|uniref:hypothetical protein n=1 Tax=Owenweeksia hongkongensis TaxID=253245 RepID=UPI003A90A68C
MINYYEILNIPNDSGKNRVYTAFKKRFLTEVNKEVKIDLLTGFLIFVNDRQKFLNILLAQYDKGKKLTPKYLAIITSERKRAESAIRNDSTETEISRALNTYPFRESITGLLFSLGYAADRYYFKLSFVAIFIGVILLFQTADDLPWFYIGLGLILIGVYAHIRIIKTVKISKIKKITAYINT